MKIFILFLSLLVPALATSQNIDKKILNTTGGESYTVTTNKETGMSFVRSTKNKLGGADLIKNIDRTKDESSIPMGYVSHTKESLSKFYQVLKTAFTAAGRPIPKNSISAIFFYNKKGEIQEIEFGESLGSELAIDDINLIERSLKKNYTFNTERDKLSEDGVYRLLYVIRFDSVN